MADPTPGESRRHLIANAGTRLRTICLPARRARVPAARPGGGRLAAHRPNATHLQLSVNAKGEAILCTAWAASQMHVLAWGAINALAPTALAIRSRSSSTTTAAGPSTSLPTRGSATSSEVQQIKATKGYLTSPTVEGARGQVHLREELLEALLRRHLPALRRAGARVAGRRVQGARRKLLGGPGLAARAAELRRSLRRPTQAVWELHLSHWTGALPVLDDQHRLVLAPVEPPLRHVHLRRQAGLRVRVDVDGAAARHVRPQRLRRHARLGLRDGLEAREQLPDAHRNRGLLLQRQPARRPPGRYGDEYRATIIGPGVTPDVMWQGAAPAPYDKAADAPRTR